MPRDLQEQRNRNRYRQAVSVYSPTRPILRPSGRVANAGTANTILGGGGQQQPQGTATSSFGTMAAPATSQLPGWQAAVGSPGVPGATPGGGSMLDRLLAANATGTATAPQPESPGGWRGALGTVVNNPVGRGVMAGLEALNYPRRIVQSSINEVADAFNGGDASFDDWTQQIGDQNFGFGNMVPDTGNTWLDRFIGLAGDIGLDPLTFVGGAGLYSGIAGRTARAGTAAEALHLGVKAGQLTSEATASKIARWGFSRFDDAARAELRAQLPGSAGLVLDRGYHFKVPLSQRFFKDPSKGIFKLPGSQLPDYLMSRGAGRVRDVISRSPFGEWMRFAANPSTTRNAITTMVTGRPTGGLSFAKAAEVINFTNSRKLAQRSFVAKVDQLANRFIADAAGGGGPGWRGRGNQTLSDMFKTAEAAGGTKAHEFYTAVREMAVKEYGVHIPEFEGAYLPHMWTDQGRQWLDGGTKAADDFKGLLYKEVDLNDPASVTRHRELLAGNTYKLGDHTFTLVDGSAEELNRIFRRLEPDAGFDLLDTDFASTAKRYAKSLEENVGIVGGLKKVLSSKSGLVRSIGDESLVDLIGDVDIANIASDATAEALGLQRRTAATVVRQIRADTQRDITAIGGSFGVELREALNEMTTIAPRHRQELDRLLAEQIELEELRGVGKYNERLTLRDGPAAWQAGTPPARQRGRLQQQFETTINTLAKQHQSLEKRLGQLQTQAVAEARRIEAQGGVGATPIQDEFERTALRAAAVAEDEETLGGVLARLEVNRDAQSVIDARLGERDFVNLAVGDDLSPKSPGARPAATPPPPAYTGPAPLDISTDFNAKRTNVLAADPQALQVSARFDAQAKNVDRARSRLWQARTNNREAIDSAHRAMVDGREYEAGLKHQVEASRGRPGELQRHVDLSQRLEGFQQGELPRLTGDYETARRPLDDAQRVFDVENKKLQQIRDEQMALARGLDARSSGTPQLPLTPTQHTELRRQRTRVVRDRARWLRTPEGRDYSKAQQQLATATGRLEEVGRRVERLTQTGGRFFVDGDGVLQTKFTSNERWAQHLVDERANVLVPARNQAEAAYETARETWERLSQQGVDVTSGELAAAQREVTSTWKAWRKAQQAVTDANAKLTKVADVPDLGQVGVQGDELRRLLDVQSKMKARVDELAQQSTVAGQTLRNFDDGIAGIDGQLQAQAEAQRLIAEAPATPYGTQVAHLHRQEQQRLDAVEAQFAGYRSNWDQPAELPATPTDLGRFEGKWDDPVIQRALQAVSRVDGQARRFDDMDVLTDLDNSLAALRAAAAPFEVPPRGTAAHTAVVNFSPASRGRAMGAVGRGQAVAAETQRFLERHVDELVDAGAFPGEFAGELFRRRLDVDRALDLHAANPSAHLRADLERQTSELRRITNFGLRYKAALEGGNEPSDALAAFLLARELDDEAADLSRQIAIGNARLADPAAGNGELAYTETLARLNEQVAQHNHNIEAEIAKGRAGQPWDRKAVETWTRELDGLQQRVNSLGSPVNGMLDDAIDSHVAYLTDDMHSLNDAVDIFDENRFVDARMQWPVRRRDELTAAIPRREAEVLSAKMSQRRLSEGVQRAQASGSQTVRYTPYNTEGFKGGVAEMPLAQAERNLAANQRVIDMLDHDLVNKQVQMSLLEGTAQDRLSLLEREIGDATTAPDPAVLAAENRTIQSVAEQEQRALSSGELETITSNRARIERLNRGGPDQRTLNSLNEEADRLRKAVDDFETTMNGDAGHVAIARDGGEDFIRGLSGPLSPADQMLLGELVGPETAAAAQTWVHYLDEVFAGRTAISGDQLAVLTDDATRVFGDNELVDRMRERAVASLASDGVVSAAEMRDELTSALLVSANRQRGEAVRETTSMQALFGSSYVDGPRGLQPRYASVAADGPSHQLFNARLRTVTAETMRRKGFDPRNAIIDDVADLRTRLGRVETMRRSIDDVVAQPPPAAAATEAWNALPPVPEGHVRLWRGQPPEGRRGAGAAPRDLPGAQREELSGRWFTPDRTTSRGYMADVGGHELRGKGRQFYVDIPQDEYDRIAGLADQTEAVRRAAGWRPSQEALGGKVKGSDEVIIPDQYLSQVQEAPNTIDMDVMRTSIANGDPNHPVMKMSDEEAFAYWREHQMDLEMSGVGLSFYVQNFGKRVPGPPRPPTPAGTAEWMDVLFTGTSSAATRTQARETLTAGKSALQAEEQQLLGVLDAPRQARLAEQHKMLGERVAAESDEIGTAMTALQRQADQAERLYTERLAEVDMELANVRRRTIEATRDYASFNTLRQQLDNTLNRTAAEKNTEGMRSLIGDMRAVNAQRITLGDPVDQATITRTEAQLLAAAESTKKLDAAQTTEATLIQAMREAEENAPQVAETVKQVITDGWRVMAKGIIDDTPEGLEVAAGLAQALENVVPHVATSNFWTFLDRYTAFFKTYATAKPGFHVRNALSATFMNLVDGVRIRDMYQGARLWRQYERNPNFWLASRVDPTDP